MSITDADIKEYSSDGFEEHIVKGVAASPGISFGRAFVLDPDEPVDPSESIAPSRIAGELDRFHSALWAVVEELSRALETAREESSTATNIVESYKMIVEDPTLAREIAELISSGVSAEAAVSREFDTKMGFLKQARDSLMRTRALDFEIIKERIVAVLRNRTLTNASAYPSIMVAPTVTPQDLLQFKQTATYGFVSEVGGINSHSCILARDMGYPAVVGIRNATNRIPMNAVVIVDGHSGSVVVNPSTATLLEYQKKVSREEEYREQLGAIIDQPTQTVDGHRMRIMANIDEPDQVELALRAGCEGIGLVRSEVLLIKLGRYPSLEEQTTWYRELAERAYPAPVTIRAFDIGNDKFRQGIPHHEDNPALGLRGIRFLLYRPDIFKAQIKAVLQASVNRNVKLMLPMVSTVEELDASRLIFDECRKELLAEGIDVDPDLPVGVMIETPAAAMMADTFAQESNFLSIGTNDLAQYALATDRMNDLVSDIYDALHPAVLKMVKMVVDAGVRFNKTVSVCGEVAGHAAATELLIGLGIRELSVSPRLALELKQRILSTSHANSLELEKRIQNCLTAKDVYAELGQNHHTDDKRSSKA